jgi:hypothetical protein
MHLVRIPFSAILLACSVSHAARAQASADSAPPPATLLVAPPAFAQWKSDTMASTGALVPSTAAGTTWWGLNTEATAAAASTMIMTQALCRKSDGCVAESIGYSLLGGLLGGAVGAGMKY